MLDQLVVGPECLDDSVVHDGDPMAGLCMGKPVRDDDPAPARHQGLRLLSKWRAPAGGGWRPRKIWAPPGAGAVGGAAPPPAAGRGARVTGPPRPATPRSGSRGPGGE